MTPCKIPRKRPPLLPSSPWLLAITLWVFVIAGAFLWAYMDARTNPPSSLTPAESLLLQDALNTIHIQDQMIRMMALNCK